MTVWFDRISYEYPACKFKLGNDSWITNDWNALIEMRIEIFIFFPLFISPTFGIGRVNSETSSSSKKFSKRTQRLRDKIGWRDRKGEGEKNAKSSIDKRASTNISTRQRVFRCNYPPPTPINSYLSANSITPSESIPSPPVEISKISEEEKWFRPWTRWPVYEKRSFPPAQRVQRRRGRRQGDNDGRKSEERLGWEVGRSKGDMSRQSKQLKSINRPSGRFADPRKGWEGLLEFRWMKIEASEEEEEEEAPFRPHPRNLAAERFKTFN